MDSSTLDAQWLTSALQHVVDVVGFGGVALAWRAGGRVAKAEARLAQLEAQAEKFERRHESDAVDHAAIREKLAALPTHDQVVSLIREVRDDIRAMRPH